MRTKRSRRSRLRVLMLVMAVLAALFAGGAALAAPGNSDNAGSEASQRSDRATDALVARADREGQLRLIVEVDRPDRGPGVAQHARANGGSKTRTFKYMPIVGLLGDGNTVRALNNHPHVVSVQEDVPEAADLAETLPIINADDTQALGWTGAGHTVAILDTGIDADHPFFNDNNGGGGSRILAQACFSDPNNADGDGQFSLCPNGGQTDTNANVDGQAQCDAAVSNCDHGTHVAGIAAGDATGQAAAPANGVAPDANILAIQVFTRHNNATDCNPNPAPCVLTFQVDQVAALNQVAAWDTTNPAWNIASANMSLGGGNNATACDGDARKAAVDTLLTQGVATVISSGNNGFLNAVGAPGCISTAVTVGNTEDNDTIRTSSNRGPLLDLFAPGAGVDSSVVDDDYGNKSGTSMSAPHVAGAFAALREAYPTRTIANLLGDMTSTGVAINYDTDGDGINDTTTPRLNLLAALQASNAPPTIAANNATVTVNEGQVAANTGTISDPTSDPVTLTASVGTVVDNGDGTWKWSWQTADGPADSQVVTISATDDKDETSSATFQLNVDNVAPTVTVDPMAAIDEGDTVTVTATFSDPGWLDTHTPGIDWGVLVGQEGELVSGPTLTVTDSGGPGSPRKGTITGTYRYGDNDNGLGYAVTVTATDKDAGAGSDAESVTVRNVAPTATIDTSGEQVYDGVSAFILKAGENLDIPASSKDPGSDDLTFLWDWDGPLFNNETPSTQTSLVNGPGTDPALSPTVQPRDVSLSASHSFSKACLYNMQIKVSDDDGASSIDDVVLLITGNATVSKGHGWWLNEYRPKGNAFTPATLQCYLDITNYLSMVFSEKTDASTREAAAKVLNAPAKAPEAVIFDQHALGAWLNFANGSIRLDSPVDSDGDGVNDSTFGAVMFEAELVRIGPGSTSAEIKAQKNIVERIALQSSP